MDNHWPGATIGRHSLSQPLRAASSLREGAGIGCVPFNVPLRNRNVTGDFHRPYATQKFFTFHHSSGDTPSVTPLRACQLPQRGSRDWAVPFNRVLAKISGYGRFSSPLRSSKVFTFHHSTKSKNHSSKSEKMGVEFLGRVWYNSFDNRCRISSLVEWSLPKPQRRVRFPYPAPQKALASAGAFLIRKIRFFVEFSEFFGIIMEIPPPMEDMLWMR